VIAKQVVFISKYEDLWVARLWDGEHLSPMVIFKGILKVSRLEPGDVIRIKKVLVESFVNKSSKIFFLNN